MLDYVVLYYMTVYYIIEYLNSENPEELAENRFEAWGLIVSGVEDSGPGI